MTDRKQALADLLEMVEAGEDASKIGQAAKAAFGCRVAGWKTGSLICWILDAGDIRAMGAAKALHEAVLPLHIMPEIMQNEHMWDVVLNDVSKGYKAISRGFDGKYPARAWLIAVIKALISQEGEE